MAILFGIVDTSILEYHEFDTLKSIEESNAIKIANGGA
jgi:hypothetical protein